MTEQKGLIFDIQSYSVHDGPGCRTLVFLSGCPLRCEWCANPEGLVCAQKIMYSRNKCKHQKLNCNRCIEACPSQAIKKNSDNTLSIDRARCQTCNTFECTEACFYEAIRLVGNWMTVSEVTKILDRDRQYWGGNGGVTFSGGEPFYQINFLQQLLKECRLSHIHTAVETTGNVPTQSFLETFKSIDFAFIDIKHMNSEKHKEKTGVGNELILKNINKLTRSNWNGRLVLRMPVIKNYNDTDENILDTIRFMNSLDLFEINILPFHRMGDSKYTQLGLNYKYSGVEATSQEKLEYIQELFLKHRIACYVGHETLF